MQDACDSVADLPPGVWVAYYYDFSGLSIHATELDALKDAFESSYSRIIYWPFGMNFTDAKAWNKRKSSVGGEQS